MHHRPAGPRHGLREIARVESLGQPPTSRRPGARGRIWVIRRDLAQAADPASPPRSPRRPANGFVSEIRQRTRHVRCMVLHALCMGRPTPGFLKAAAAAPDAAPSLAPRRPASRHGDELVHQPPPGQRQHQLRPGDPAAAPPAPAELGIGNHRKRQHQQEDRLRHLDPAQKPQPERPPAGSRPPPPAAPRAGRECRRSAPQRARPADPAARRSPAAAAPAAACHAAPPTCGSRPASRPPHAAPSTRRSEARGDEISNTADPEATGDAPQTAVPTRRPSTRAAAAS